MLPIPVTEDKQRPIRSYFWSRDSKYILYAQDKGGDENFRIYAVDPLQASQQSIPESRDLTPYENIRAFIYALPRKEHHIIYVGINDRDSAWHDIYAIDINNGQRTLIHQNNENLSDVCFDLEGKLRLASRSLPNGGSEILKKEEKGFVKILESTLEETLNPIRFHVNNNDVYFISNVGQPDHIGLYLYNIDSKEMKLVDSDPMKEVDLEDLRFSPKTEELIATIYIGDKKRVYWQSKDHQIDFEFLKREFEGSEIDITSTTKDETNWLIYVFKR